MSIVAVVHKEFRQIGRDRRTLGVLIFLPLFLLVMFGYAVTLDVSHAPVAVVDLDGSRLSRRVIAALDTNTRYFDLHGVYSDRRVLEGLLARGIVQGAVVLPETLSRSVAGGEPVEVQILIDGSNGTTAGALQGYLRAVVADVVTEAAVNASGSAGGGRGVQLETRVWFNPEMDSSRYLIPGLVAFILVITGVISTALSIVREKELGTLEQISASPLSPVTLVLGKTLPYMALSAALAVAIFAAGYVFFGVDVAGGVGWLAVVTALFLVASLGLGILISSIADTQQVAFMVSILITFLPAFILSGFIFPIENMPTPIRLVTYIVPARYYIAALRVIMLKGGGPSVFWPDALFLIAFAVVTLGVGVVRLKTWRRRL